MSNRDPCVRAGKLFQEEKYEEALRAITRCRKENVRSRKKRGTLDLDSISREVSIGILEGNILFNLNKLKKAEEVFKHSYRLITNEDYFKPSGETSRIKGKILYSLALCSKKQERKISLLNQAREEFKKAKLQREIVETTIRLAHLYATTDQKDQAIHENKELIKLSKKLKDKRSRQYVKGQAYLDLARLENDDSRVLKLFEKARKEYRQVDAIRELIEVDFEQGQHMLNRGNEKGKRMVMDALERAKLNNIVELETRIKYALGIESIKSGDLDDAASNIIEALSMQAESDDPRSSGTAKLELARIRFSNGKSNEDYDISLNLAKSALESFTTVNDRRGMALANELLGNIYVIQNKTRLATKALKRAKTYFSELKDDEALGRVYTITADAAAMEKNSGLTLSNLRKAEGYYKKTGSKLGLSDIFQRYIIYYIQMEKDAIKAKEFIKKLRDIINSDFPHESAKLVIEKQLERFEQALK